MAEQTIIEIRVANLENAVGKIEQAVSSIAASMQAIVRLEEHHTQTRDSIERAFVELSDHEKRLRVLENDAPTMRMVRQWVTAWVVGVAGLVGAALVALVLVKVPI